MDAREETRRFGYCTLDPAKHVKDEQVFLADIRKQKRLMKHRDIREEEEVKKLFSYKPARRPSFKTTLAMILPILLVTGVCLYLAWRLFLLV